MKKIILLFLLSVCVTFQASAGDLMIFAGGMSATPCITMGASGAYQGWANADYSGDTDKMCLDSGASTQNGTISGLTINSSSPITGTKDFLINAGDEYIRWNNPLATLADAGTIEFSLKVPATTNGSTDLFSVYQDADNYIRGYFGNTSSVLAIQYHGDTADDFSIGPVIVDGTTYKEATSNSIIFTWDVAANKGYMSIDNGDSWTGTMDDATEFTGAAATVSIGEDYTLGAIVDAWQIDDFQIRAGYEGP
jgi:hypothetical protein